MEKTKKETLKKRYEKKSIKQLEMMADQTSHDSLRHRRKFIEILEHIYQSKRWPENAIYTKSEWRGYLKGRFNITISAWNKERQAFYSFPEATEELGIGIVSMAVKICGKSIGGLILSDLVDKNKTRKTKVAYEDMVKELEKHRKPKKVSFTPTGPTKKELQDEIARKIVAIADLQDELAEKNEKIKKLEKSLKEYKHIATLIDAATAPKGEESMPTA